MFNDEPPMKRSRSTENIASTSPSSQPYFMSLLQTELAPSNFDPIVPPVVDGHISPRKRKFDSGMGSRRDGYSNTQWETQVLPDSNYDMQQRRKAVLPQTTNRRRKNVTRACLGCNKSHAACEETRPCARCIRLKIPCVEVPRAKGDKPAETKKRTPPSHMFDDRPDSYNRSPIHSPTHSPQLSPRSAGGSSTSSLSPRMMAHFNGITMEEEFEQRLYSPTTNNFTMFDVDENNYVGTMPANTPHEKPSYVLVTVVFDSGEKKTTMVPTPTDLSQMHAFQVGVDHGGAIITNYNMQRKEPVGYQPVPTYQQPMTEYVHHTPINMNPMSSAQVNIAVTNIYGEEKQARGFGQQRTIPLEAIPTNIQREAPQVAENAFIRTRDNNSRRGSVFLSEDLLDSLTDDNTANQFFIN